MARFLSLIENKQGLYQRALRRYEAVTTANVELLSGLGHPKDLIRQLLMRVVEDELGDPQRRGWLAHFFLNTMQGIRVLSKGTPPKWRRQCLLDVVEVALDKL